jgi:hypothetical protein
LTNFALSDNVPHVLYIDGNGDVDQIWYQGTGFLYQNLTAGGPAGTSDDLTSYLVADGAHVYYIATDQDVNQLWWTGSAWVNQDLTAGVGGPPAMPGGGLANYSGPDGQHVFYIDANQNVNQLWWTGQTEIAQNLTAGAGAPLTAIGSPLTAFALSDNIPHVVYIDTNNHIEQLWWQGTGFVHQDLTAMTGGPAAGGGIVPPSGTVQIQASPNPLVVTDGSGMGQIVVTYSAPGINDAQVFINNNLLCANGSAGSCQASNVSNGTVFSVREASGLILAATTVTVSTPKASLVALDGTVFLPNGNTANPTLSYAAAGASNVAIYANGVLVCQGGSSGTCQTSNIANGTVFTMNDANTGAQLSSLTFNTLPASSNYCEVQ